MTTELSLGYLGYGTGQHAPFDQVFPIGKRIPVERVRECDALVIWGGEDISTSFYNEDGNKWTDADRRLSTRDFVEKEACEEAIKHGIPIIGVCRGAQLLCALAGGKLVQHVDGHAGRGDHFVDTDDGRRLITTSLHHQMMWPFPYNGKEGPEHKLIAWSSNNLANVYCFNNYQEPKKEIEYPEPEVVWFPKIKGLAIQGHPEFMDERDEFVQYCMELVRKYIV